jgi:SAM-dependent methyltransferase
MRGSRQRSCVHDQRDRPTLGPNRRSQSAKDGSARARRCFRCARACPLHWKGANSTVNDRHLGNVGLCQLSDCGSVSMRDNCAGRRLRKVGDHLAREDELALDSHVENLLTEEPERYIARYRENYRLKAATPVTAAMLRKHWSLEHALARELRASTTDDRAVVFEHAYTTLYAQCPWLIETGAGSGGDIEETYGYIAQLLGNAQSVYEVGSGNGFLIRMLARRGFTCTATDITAKRSACFLRAEDGIEWHATDGVHLSDYEPSERYDAVISTQVLEHLHPDDLGTHLRHARTILKLGGSYLVETPHAFSGPADLSRVFGLNRPACMHLREYTYRELVQALRGAEFSAIEAVYVPPQVIRRRLNIAFPSTLYLQAILTAESALARASGTGRAKLVSLLARVAVWRPNVVLRAKKG